MGFVQYCAQFAAADSQWNRTKDCRCKRISYNGERLMPSFAPIKRAEFIKALCKAGFECPYSSGKHQFMQRGTARLRIPNPHENDS
jgi:predicted RNA binding protein YcfA (HicA-like mRNA interferase family)